MVDHRGNLGGVRPSRRIRSTLVGAYPSAKLGSVAEARPPEKFGRMSPKVESWQNLRRVTPGANFDWGGILYPTMIKSLFTEKVERASNVLSLIHTDVCGSMSTSTKGEYYNFITFTDDLSRYGHIYLMTHKLKSFEIFKWFHNEVEK